jgi:Family of unknown function (DUF5302)
MTKSAKQDTAKAPAEPAETESAATQAQANPETTAEPEETSGAETSAAGTAGAETVDTGEDSAKPDLDDTKRKFREALERKQQAHNESQGRGGRDGGKISGAHGPAASRRNFRRKSG